MNGRRALLLAALLLLPLGAAAQTAPATSRSQTTTRRRRRPRPAPPPENPAPPPVSRGDPAPVPNLDIEPPRGPRSTANPRLDPALIDPAEPRFSATMDPHGPQAREDRLLRQPAAGARLRVPFTP